MAVDWGKDTPHLVDEEQRRHTHLRLAAALDPQPRRTRPGGSRGPVRYPNRDQHGQQIQRQLSSIRESHQTRTAIFGISPDLVMVVEFNREMTAPDESVEQAGLRFLAARERRAIAAFASDSDLVEFLRHLELYQEGVPPNRRTAHYEDLFDAIEQIRPLAPSDVLDTAVQRRVSELSEDDTIRVDVQCWCPDDEPEARRRFDETIQAIEVARGNIVDKSFRWQSGLSLIRADVPADAIWRLADIDRVRKISLLPQPLLTAPQVTTADYRSLPQVLPPDDGAPIVAVIDSGVRAGHPLLAPAMYATAPAGTQLRDGSDEHGHGTLVASLALYGSLESLLSSREPVKAAGRLLSIRVLDKAGYFPEEDLWDKQLAAAIELAAHHGARVVNLSLGDSTHPYIPPSPDPIAAMVDELAKRYQLVIVISTGNFGEAEYLRDADIAYAYPTWLLEHEGAGLLPPAMAALALTTGALVAGQAQGMRPARDSVDIRPIGEPGQPSPATRAGPGIEDMIKPELMAAGGTYAYDSGMSRFAESPYGKVVGASHKPDRLFVGGTGTSFAAPLVAHAALRVLGRYPSLSANAVRALLLATTDPVEPMLTGDASAEQRAANMRLAGFGQVIVDHAEYSADHRVVLLAEDAIQMNQVHFYTLPVPDAFFSRGPKMIALGFAFNPDVRATRLTYMSNRMSVFVYRGVPVEHVRAKYALHPDDDAPPEELESYRCKDLQPPDRIRRRGANQAASQFWSQGWDRKYAGQLVIAVRNTNRWASNGENQDYALAVTIRTHEHLEPPLYARLRAQLPLITEIEPEIELE